MIIRQLVNNSQCFPECSIAYLFSIAEKAFAIFKQSEFYVPVQFIDYVLIFCLIFHDCYL